MLEQQPWIRYAPELDTEWKQCYDEGLDVGDCKALCKAAALMKDMPEEAAWAIGQMLRARPMRKDYPYTEPTEYAEILAARPKTGTELSAPSVPERDQIKGAWIGRIAGCILGKPVEGYRTARLWPLLQGTENYPMHKYICKRDFKPELVKRLDVQVDSYWADNLGNVPFTDDDTNYTVFSLKLVETYGAQFTPQDVLEARLAWVPYLTVCTAERVSYRNAAMGLLPPETATYKNPYREGVGAQIRADFYGYICPGDPERAAAMAYRDAVTSHTKNGVYGAMFTAAMIAAAAVTADREQLILAGLSQIPARCRLAEALGSVLESWRGGVSHEALVQEILRRYDENTIYGWAHTIPNAMIVAAAILYGEGDFGKTICLAVQSGFDTDCNGATAGSVAGLLNGASGIAPDWLTPFGGKLCTMVDGYYETDVDTLTEHTLGVMHRVAVQQAVLNNSFAGGAVE